jgi:hypothetical protein
MNNYKSWCKDCGCSPSWHTGKFTSCKVHKKNRDWGHFIKHECWGYLPSDNLEYLEYLSEKNKKV